MRIKAQGKAKSANRSSKKSSRRTSQAASRRPRQFLTEEAVSGLSKMSLKKRSQILDAALACFIELGYEGTSMSAVAERAGVIKQTIYSHFASKELLFKKVIQVATVDHLHSQLATPDMVGKAPKEVLLRFGRTLLERHQDPIYGKFFRTMIGEAGRFPELAELFTEATVRPGTELVCEIFGNRDEFAIEDPEAFARVFIGTIIAFCIHQYVLRGRDFYAFDQERVLNELMRLVEMQRR